MRTGMTIKDGFALPASEPGLGIDWDPQALHRFKAEGSDRVLKA